MSWRNQGIQSVPSAPSLPLAYIVPCVKRVCWPYDQAGIQSSWAAKTSLVVPIPPKFAHIVATGSSSERKGMVSAIPVRRRSKFARVVETASWARERESMATFWGVLSTLAATSPDQSPLSLDISKPNSAQESQMVNGGGYPGGGVCQGVNQLDPGKAWFRTPSGPIEFIAKRASRFEPSSARS